MPVDWSKVEQGRWGGIDDLSKLIVAEGGKTHRAQMAADRPDTLSDLIALQSLELRKGKEQRQEEEQSIKRQERAEKKVQDIADRATKAGTAVAVPAVKRAEREIPGLFTGDGKKPKLKSVGGWKTLAPNWAVPLLETVGALPEGAGKERTAIQELMNVKIYDASGKQINEQEMKRIQEAMALKGIFEPDAIVEALRGMGHVIVSKQKQVTAGADPKALETFKKRGGIAGQSMEELLGRTGPPPGRQAAPQPSQPTTQNKQALEWARANPNDPRSAQILQKLGVAK